MLRERIAAARERREGIRIVAAGTWLEAGHPVAATSMVSVAELHGIVEYVPGDLTLTARAGTSIADLYRATREQDQWLPLDPWGGDGGTIGATVSTATAGPHTFSMGAPRDVVLGLEFVSGTGDTIRAGGRVVKNVAGFDLTRLVIGAWGTLGIVTEVTVRLRARPQQLRTICIAVGDSATALNDLAVTLRSLPFTPLASELINATLARQLGVGARTMLLARVGGNAASLARQLDALAAIARCSDAPSDIWARLRAAEVSSVASWRWSDLPSRFGETWMAATSAARDLDAGIHGSPQRGVVRVVAGAGAPTRQLSEVAASVRTGRVIERMPGGSWPATPARATSGLETSLRARFDPDGVLNPGIMGGNA